MGERREVQPDLRSSEHSPQTRISQAPDVHAPGSSDWKALLLLQRAAGNTAVSSLLAAQFTNQPVVQRGSPTTRTRPAWSSAAKGDIGELWLEQILELNGFEVYRDWDKRVNEWGIDTVAYDPASDFVWFVDNKAQATNVRGASALEPRPLIEANIDRARGVLDRHSGFSEKARAALKAGRVRLAVSNANPEAVPPRATSRMPISRDFRIGFSAAVFQRGWYAIDIVTGGMYSNLAAFNAARSAFLEGAQAAGTVVGGMMGRRVPQRGFATVGGMIFALVSIGGVLLALSEIRSLKDLRDFVVANAISGGASIAAGAAFGGGIGLVVGMVLGMSDDQGPGVHERAQRSMMVHAFLHQRFSDEEILKGGAPLYDEARAFLFDTAPMVVPDEVDGSTIGKLARMAVNELDGAGAYKVLLSVFLQAAKLHGVQRFGTMLQSKLDVQRGDYFIRFISKLRDENERGSASILKIFTKAGVDVAAAAGSS